MMNNIKETIQTMRRHFGWDQSDTIAFMVDALIEESYELKESIEDSEAFKKEMADVLMYALAICIDLDIDVEAIIDEKAKEVMKRDY